MTAPVTLAKPPLPDLLYTGGLVWARTVHADTSPIGWALAVELGQAVLGGEDTP